MRRVRLVIGCLLIILFNLPTLLTNRVTNDTMSEVLERYDTIPSAYISSGILNMLDYVKLYNIAADANTTIWQFEVTGHATSSEYLSAVISKADVWNRLELPNDKLLNTIKRGMLLIGKDNTRARELLGAVLSSSYFKYIVIIRAFCYEIRFKAVGFYFVLILISIVIAGLLVYDKISSLHDSNENYLDEAEDIYGDE